MKNISNDSKRIIEQILRRYQDNKIEYDNMIDSLMGRSPVHDGQPHGMTITKPVEQTAVELNSWLNGAKAARLEREINAVESVYNMLRPEEQEVIRLRFFCNRNRNTPYRQMENKCSYSERQMNRIITGVLINIGKKIGEI